MNRLPVILWSGLCLASVSPQAAMSRQVPILLDGEFEDWNGVPPAWQDPTGDAGPDSIDFGRIWIANDDRFLYLRFEVGAQIDLDEDSPISLYLDTDADSATGLQVGGIGAELEWNLGERAGAWYWRRRGMAVDRSSLGFTALPTTNAREYEACFSRASKPDGVHPLFPGASVRLLLVDRAPGGDRAPDPGLVLTYTLDDGSAPPDTAVPWTSRAGNLRLATWNIHADGLYNPDLQPAFLRVLSAAHPAVLCLQEVYKHTPEETASLLESCLPSGSGESWHFAANQDCQVISRYPILASWPLDGNTVVLLDTSSILGNPILVICAHLPCCTNDAGRQREVDHLLAFIRDGRESGGTESIPPNAPIVILGDMNFVGSPRPLQSLLSGVIADHDASGPDFHPDWDGTALRDLISRQTEVRQAWTWFDPTTTYWPGRLDLVIYTDSVLEPGNHFLVDTREMSPDSLAAHGLQAGDSAVSDHLIHVADFHPAPSGQGGGGSDSGGTVGRSDAGSDSGGTSGQPGAGFEFTVLPNPSRGVLEIRAVADRPTRFRAELVDPSGRHAVSLFGGSERAVSPGQTILSWAGADEGGRSLPSGLYLIRVWGEDERGSFRRCGRWMLMR